MYNGPPRFKEGRAYRCLNGEMVTVLECKNEIRGYETTLGSDGIHRYNRTTGFGGDQGRVTGTDHDNPDPHNFDRSQIGLPLKRWKFA